MLAGFSPLQAIANFKIGQLGHLISAFHTFYKAKKVKLSKRILVFVLRGIVGSILGAYIVLQIPESVLKIFIYFAILILGFYFAFFKKDFEKPKNYNPKNIQLGSLLYFLSSIYSGILGAGNKVINVLIVSKFLNKNLLETNGFLFLSGVFKILFVVIIFGSKGVMNYKMSLPFMLDTIIGGLLSSKIMIKKGNKWSGRIMGVIVIAIAVLSIFQNVLI
ncbi:hypothetical protein HRbin34_00327 [bacterium HR34]|nr:hypothetical protein HRbin34_00327 [bacterium HR34]